MLSVDILKEDPNEYKKYMTIQEQFEREGNFNTDINENSYDGTLPVTEDFEFIKKGIKNAFKHAIYSTAMRIYTNKICKLLKVEIKGKENLKGIKSAIITCNHIFYARLFFGFYEPNAFFQPQVGFLPVDPAGIAVPHAADALAGCPAHIQHFINGVLVLFVKLHH